MLGLRPASAALSQVLVNTLLSALLVDTSLSGSADGLMSGSGLAHCTTHLFHLGKRLRPIPPLLLGPAPAFLCSGAARASLACAWLEMSGLTWKVASSAIRRDQGGDFAEYVLEVQCGGQQWKVSRRYRAFRALHKKLQAHKLDLPSFPSEAAGWPDLLSAASVASILGKGRTWCVVSANRVVACALAEKVSYRHLQVADLLAEHEARLRPEEAGSPAPVHGRAAARRGLLAGTAQVLQHARGRGRRGGGVGDAAPVRQSVGGWVRRDPVGHLAARRRRPVLRSVPRPAADAAADDDGLAAEREELLLECVAAEAN